MQQTFRSIQMYVVYVFHGFALLNDNYVPPNYSMNVLKSEFIRNADINRILGFAEKTTISAASTTTTTIFNETSSGLSTGQPTSAETLESTAVTTENATGMAIDQWRTSAEGKWQHSQSYYCKPISATQCQDCALLHC